MDLLKWVGNKRWLLERYAHHLPAPEIVVAYRESFLGTGAIAERYLGAIGRDGEPLACRLSDANADLIEMYRMVRDHSEIVIGLLATYAFDGETYYKVRSLFNERRDASPVLRAVWFLYLNRTCFNGLYRVNRRGEFNVPMGDYANPTICDPERIFEASRMLQQAQLSVCGYAEALADVRRDEFVFLDPPYAAASDTANFTAYAAGGFTMVDQRALAEELERIDRVGARFLLTNADTPETRELYAGWQIQSVQVKRSVSAKASSRKSVNEILVANYELEVS